MEKSFADYPYIDYNNFTETDAAGEGSFGKVYKVTHNIDKKEYAAKQITITERSPISNIKREIDCMINFQHPTILQFKGISFKLKPNNEKIPVILTNYVENGSLLKYCHKPDSDKIDDTIRQIILIGISYGMMIFHKKDHIHRDLKPDNVLIDERFHPIISDFGFSKAVNLLDSLIQSSAGGTPLYMAPEILNKRYGRKVDIYAFGISMYELVAQCTPYPKKKQDMYFLTNVAFGNLRPKRHRRGAKPMKDSIWELCKKCWDGEPSKRPTFEDIFLRLAFNIGTDQNENGYDRYYLSKIDVDKLFQYIESIVDDHINLEELVEKLTINIVCNEILLSRKDSQLSDEERKFIRKTNSLKEELKRKIERKWLNRRPRSVIGEKVPSLLITDDNDIDEEEKFNSLPPMRNESNFTKKKAKIEAKNPRSAVANAQKEVLVKSVRIKSSKTCIISNGQTNKDEEKEEATVNKEKEETSDKEEEEEAVVNKEKEEATVNKEKEEAINKEKGATVNKEKEEAINKEKGATVNKEKKEAINKEKEEAINKEKEEAINKEKEEAINKEKEEAINKEKKEAINKEKEEAINKEKEEAINKEKEATVNKEKGATVNKEKGATVNKEKEATVNKEKEATVNKEKEATVNKEKGATVNKEKGATVNKEKGATVNKEKGATVNKEKGATVNKEKEATVNKEKEATVNKEKEATVNKEKGATVNKEKGATVNKEKGATVNKEKGATVNKEKGATVNKEKGATVNKEKEATIDKEAKANITKPGLVLRSPEKDCQLKNEDTRQQLIKKKKPQLMRNPEKAGQVMHAASPDPRRCAKKPAANAGSPQKGDRAKLLRNEFRNELISECIKKAKNQPEVIRERGLVKMKRATPDPARRIQLERFLNERNVRNKNANLPKEKVKESPANSPQKGKK